MGYLNQPQEQQSEETGDAMELGNMCFGHSRGEYRIARDGGFERELTRLFQTIDPEFNTTYGDEFQNKVFEIHPYYWGDCNCGYEKAEEKWCNEHQHSPDCYQTSYKAIPYDWFKEKEDHEIEVRRLCEKHGIPYNKGFGSAIHCTCDYNPEWIRWTSTHDHHPNCLVVRPNFWYKPSDYRLMWYKYPLRDSYANQELSLQQFHDLISDCINSLGLSPDIPKHERPH